ncbi:flavodoxin domain-containing protein [Kocuria sp. CPCC 205292]|uniref:flavodoxin domain-containing protein n=1 Tax=Kocuria cellulosilytica TaxID=3071451 RepID=UPI0034D4AA94
MRILVGHASRQGPTVGIARRSAATPERAVAAVEAAPVGEVGDPAGYDAVVLDSAVHNQPWSPETADVAHRHAAVPSSRPLWMFGVGRSDGLPRPLRRMAGTAQDQRVAAALREDVQPRGHRAFSGVCRPEQLPRWVGVTFRAVGAPFGDYRDRPAIEAWFQQIAQELDVRSVAEGAGG